MSSEEEESERYYVSDEVSVLQGFSVSNKASLRSGEIKVYRPASQGVCRDIVDIMAKVPEGTVQYTADVAKETACMAFKGNTSMPPDADKAMPDGEFKRTETKLKTLIPVVLAGEQSDRFEEILAEKGVEVRADTRVYWQAFDQLKDEERLARRVRQKKKGPGRRKVDPYALSESEDDSDGGKTRAAGRKRRGRRRGGIKFQETKPVGPPPPPPPPAAGAAPGAGAVVTPAKKWFGWF